MSSFEDLAREHSRLTGKYVVLIRSSNGGSTTRYSAFDPFGREVRDTLADDDAAYLVLDSHQQLIPMVQQAVENVRDNAGLLTLDIVAFEDGAEVYATSAD